MNDFLQSLRNGQAEKPRSPKTRKNYDNSYHYTSQPRYNSYGNGYQNTRGQQNMKRPPLPQQGNQLPMDDITPPSMLSEAIENLCSHIEILAKNQDYLINAQERTADMLERQAIAIERIVNHLNIAPAPEASFDPNTIQDKEQVNASDEVEDNETEQDFGNQLFTPSLDPEPEQVVKRPAKKTAKRAAKANKPMKAKGPAEVAKPVKHVIRKRKKIVTKKVEAMAPIDSKLLSREAVMDIINTMRAEGATFDQVASRLVELGQPTFSGRGEWHAQTIHRLCNKK
jgi:hypothetical protein